MMAATEVTDATLLAFADDVGSEGSVAVEGARTRWNIGGELHAGCRLIRAPEGIVTFSPDEMIVRVRAGTPVDELHEALAEGGQRTSLPERGGTVGGALAVGEDATGVLGAGKVRSSLLQIRYVSADGRLVTGGGPTVKNVSGFDLPRLMVGSLGTLGIFAEVTLRTRPVPATSVWLVTDDADPFDVFARLFRPSCVLWDGQRTWVHLEGHATDVEAQRDVLEQVTDVAQVVGPPVLPAHRWSLRPSDLRQLPVEELGSFVASIGFGLVFASFPQSGRRCSPALRELADRMKKNFDPTMRLNPGRDPAFAASST